MRTATSAAATSIATRLSSEWAQLAERSFEYGGLGLRCAGELLAEALTASAGEQDRLLHQLIELAQEGHRAAERLLLQLMLPTARKQAHRIVALQEYGAIDRIGLALTGAWESIQLYPLRRTRSVLANLRMETLKNLSRRHRGSSYMVDEATVAVDTPVLIALAGEWTPEPSAERELANLFTWALDMEVITSAEVSLLARTALGDEKVADIAAEMGVPAATLRQRISRAMRRLGAAAQKSYIATR